MLLCPHFQRSAHIFNEAAKLAPPLEKTPVLGGKKGQNCPNFLRAASSHV